MTTLPRNNFGKRCRQRCENALLHFLARSTHLLPLRAALALGRGLGWLAPRISPRHLRRICSDISSALQLEADSPEVCRIAHDSYRYLGENLLEFLRLPYLSSEQIRDWAPLEGWDKVQAALARGNGVILLTGHLGNWELTGAAIGLCGHPASAVAREQLDAEQTDLFNSIRETHGLRVIPMQNVRECIRTLRKNELLGILADTNDRNPAAFVQFFGRPAATYTGIAYLAELTGAAILPIFSSRTSTTQYRIVIGDEVPKVENGTRQENIFHTTIRIQQVIEDEIRQRPHEWFWLQRRWATTPEKMPNPEQIHMEHRDLTAEQSNKIRHWHEAD